MKTLSPSLIAKVSWRLLPFLLLMYILAFLDRVNVGFAKQAFQADTGVSDAAFALGAGIFFVGYALLEVPSNLILHKVGARLWMCRIMVTWGLVSAALVFAHGETSFYLLRFLLGVTEAGFFPGIIYYLTCWFPSAARGRAMGFFYFGAPLAFIFGSPLSGLLLELHGVGGWNGWQWMFAIEGLMASVVGVWAYFYLDNRPAEATWLTQEERTQLQDVLDQENRGKTSHSHNLFAAICQPAVLFMSLIYALIQASVYGVVFYLPTQVAGLMDTKVGLAVGLVSAIPWVCAVLAAWLIPAFADRTGNRRGTACLTLLMSAAGIAVSVSVSSPLAGVLALCFAAAGFIAVQPIFWTFPSRFVAGSVAAGGIALINSIGGVGGFLAPMVKNWADSAFHSSAAGLYVLATTTVLAALLMLGLHDNASSATRARATT
ncbi:MFS transporter [Bordetella sp. FB-8]|uniref:MFS transporter n=1 Tax=Bordetella sp. FB-8 TaxID=1159870 RepID=UPI0003819958|nr:MFS transporter [Bordetella sp. FB-8]